MIAATLVDRVLATEGPSRLWRDGALVLAGSLLLALSAKAQVPLYVPITLQSLVVLVLAASFGARLAALTIGLYLLQGAAGLPVFAGTPEKGIGLAYMMGPTGGFLVGFLLAGLLVGWLAERGMTRNVPRAILTMALGHAVLFACGILWLSRLIGFEAAFAVGFAPFYAATAIKTALAAALLPAAHWAVDRMGRKP